MYIFFANVLKGTVMWVFSISSHNSNYTLIGTSKNTLCHRYMVSHSVIKKLHTFTIGDYVTIA